MRLLSVRMHFRLVHVFTTSFFCCIDEWPPLPLYREVYSVFSVEQQKFIDPTISGLKCSHLGDVTQVDTWNSFMFPYIPYMHSLKVTWYKLHMNSFSASAGWLWCILFVLVAWCWLSKGFRIWRTSYFRLFDYFYLDYLLFTCLIFSQCLGIKDKGIIILRNKPLCLVWAMWDLHVVPIHHNSIL